MTETREYEFYWNGYHIVEGGRIAPEGQEDEIDAALRRFLWSYKGEDVENGLPETVTQYLTENGIEQYMDIWETVCNLDAPYDDWDEELLNQYFWDSPANEKIEAKIEVRR